MYRKNISIYGTVVRLYLEGICMCDDSRSDRDPFERLLSENGSLAGGEQYQNKIEVNLHAFDEQFWLKKIRYALKEGDQNTQRKLQQQFGPVVIQLIENHPQAKA